MTNDVFEKFGVSKKDYEYDPATDTIRLKPSNTYGIPVEMPTEIIPLVFDPATNQILEQPSAFVSDREKDYKFTPVDSIPLDTTGPFTGGYDDTPTETQKLRSGRTIYQNLKDAETEMSQPNIDPVKPLLGIQNIKKREPKLVPVPYIPGQVI